MPVYNSERYLSLAIDSILSQSFKNFEFLIIYDDSDDNSFKLINEYSLSDQRIKIIRGKKNGILGAINQGFKKSDGDFIVRMDADDVSKPERLQKQLEYIRKNNLDICGSHCLIINDIGLVNDLFLAPLSHEACTLSLAFDVPFVHPSVMIRKEFLLKNNLRYGQSESVHAEDYDLWIRMHSNGAKFGNINEVLLSYRVLKDSLSRLNRRNVSRDTKALSKKFYRDNLKINSENIGLISNGGNSKEKSLVVSFLISRIFRLSFKNIHHIKNISLKIILHTVISEFARKIRLTF